MNLIQAFPAYDFDLAGSSPALDEGLDDAVEVARRFSAIIPIVAMMYLEVKRCRFYSVSKAKGSDDAINSHRSHIQYLYIYVLQS